MSLSSNSQSINAVILGASGYVGGELLRLIHGHPNFELLAAVSDSKAGNPVSATFGHLAQSHADLKFMARNEWQQQPANGADVALFSAAPHGASAEVIAAAIQTAMDNSWNLHVVDSSADFRYAEQRDWESVYAATHGAPELLKQFTCVVPEHSGPATTAHIGHPGCFATATLLAAVPLLQSGLTEAEIFVSGVTGSTGSGRSPQAGTHHPERNSNLYAYKPLAHRHAPEVAALIKAASDRETKVHFVPHSGPFARGIHITLQARAKAPVDESQLRKVFEQAYSSAAFVNLVDGTPRLKDVVASNMCNLSVATDGESVVVMSVIDNLVKGAAGGAVQWMNRLWELPETAGLQAAAPGWT
ncbi:MAG: N-acetyl-gamma-glutamyl-phosphate reductase [Gammaproteobacteria bacterium]|nr:N-acetyl-gamma-glutamyl-phosphate reductase [Gammaproteobacteria bacterium]